MPEAEGDEEPWEGREELVLPQELNSYRKPDAWSALQTAEDKPHVPLRWVAMQTTMDATKGHRFHAIIEPLCHKVVICIP